ncbi:MAG: hypothetical protein HZB43_04155 [candidate division Zixibacteria bacterium]|nr:hypothetical protein [candidate division Zixibacteria bacterium]
MSLVLCLAGLTTAVQAEESTRPIGRITVQTLNVYSPEEIAKGWPYRVINALHFRTKESIIRRFLLFKEGDTLAPYLVTETERNLRALPFLKSVTIATEPDGDTATTVTITTQDSWTTEPAVSFELKGGKALYGFELKEKSLFGTGRALLFNYDKQLDRTVRSLVYRDPILIGPYWYGEALFAWLSDGWEKAGLIERPFYTFTAGWALRMYFDDSRQSAWIYRDARVVSQFRQAHTQYEGQVGLALFASQGLARRLTLGFDGIDDRFDSTQYHANDLLPGNRRFRYLTIGYEEVANDYLKLNYINRDQRFEDINLGHQLTAQVGISPSAFGTPRSILRFTASAQQGFRLAAKSYQLTTVNFESRWDRRPRNTILTATAGCVLKFESPILQTTVARLQFKQGWNLDLDKQFYADVEYGLRGYRPYVFAGDMSLIANLEQRIFYGHELLQIASPGLALFCDIGAAGRSGQWRSMNFATDIGAGLRLGLPRAAQHNVIRIDFAYALRPDPLGRKGWLVSIASRQAF